MFQFLYIFFLTHVFCIHFIHVIFSFHSPFMSSTTAFDKSSTEPPSADEDALREPGCEEELSFSTVSNGSNRPTNGYLAKKDAVYDAWHKIITYGIPESRSAQSSASCSSASVIPSWLSSLSLTSSMLSVPSARVASCPASAP